MTCRSLLKIFTVGICLLCIVSVSASTGPSHIELGGENIPLNSTGDGFTKKDACDFAQGFSVGLGVVSLFGCFACAVASAAIGVGHLILC